MKAKILFIEDDLSLQKSIAFILEKEGYEVITANTGEEAITIAMKDTPDLILLDLMLPGIDGFEVCKVLKNSPVTSDIFIIMLTGKRMVNDITKGLCLYADDYITKPFEPSILLSRILAILRRKSKITEYSKKILQFKDLTIDLEGRVVNIGGLKSDLTKTEYDLLVLLAGNPNIVFTRSKILDRIRQDDFELTDRIVDFQISGLRKKLNSAGKYIETVRGVGYKFII